MSRELIRQGQRRRLNVIVTNSDGDLDRRRELAALLGNEELEFYEEIIDPGQEVVEGRLANRLNRQAGSGLQAGHWALV